MKEKHKIIIDTDIGDDIDDAFAIATVLNSDNIEIVGITTVYKNTLERAYIVKALLKAYNKNNVKVHCGENNPLVGQILSHQKETIYPDGQYRISHYFDDMKCGGIDKESAIDFILSQAEKFPNEIELVCIGPLTNIAKAYQKNKTSFSKLKSILIMGGANNTHREWNFRCDPESAKIVFESGVSIKVVGYDITVKAVIDSVSLDKLYGKEHSGAKLICKMLDVWKSKNPQKIPTLHDGLTAMCLVDNCCSFETKLARVIADGEKKALIDFESSRAVNKIEIAVGANYKKAINFIINSI